MARSRASVELERQVKEADGHQAEIGRKIAAALREPDMNMQSAVSRWINGAQPRARAIIAMKEAFGIDPAWWLEPAAEESGPLPAVAQDATGTHEG